MKTKQNYEDILTNWRNDLLKMNFINIVLQCIFEILFFVVFAKYLDVKRNVWGGVIFPTSINLTMHIFTRMLIAQKTITNEIKNALPLIELIVIITNIVYLHYMFSALYLLFVVPLFVSIIYGNLVITKNIFHIILSILTILIVTAEISITPLPKNFNHNVLITFAIFLLGYVLTNIMIKHEKEKEKFIIAKEQKATIWYKKSIQDELTNVYNHAFMEMKITEEIKNKTEIYFAILDIDDFKKVNDEYGHEKGNEVLKHLGQILNNESSEEIIPTRYGGEEFGIIFLNKKENEIVTVLDRIHSIFRNSSYPDVQDRITFSGGVTKYAANEDIHTFIKRADDILYKAKKSGKNKIIILNNEDAKNFILEDIKKDKTNNISKTDEKRIEQIFVKAQEMDCFKNKENCRRLERAKNISRDMLEAVFVAIISADRNGIQNELKEIDNLKTPSEIDIWTAKKEQKYGCSVITAINVK